MAHGNLPTNITTFVGRTRELSKLTELLSEDRLVTLVGSGGCGKTRLAIEVAHGLQDRYDGGCWFVDLTILSSGELVPALVTSVLGMPPSNDPVQDRLANHFSQSQSLLILDNCEHLVDEVAALADSLVDYCPSLHLLATSREPLGVEGERVYRVGSLRQADSIALFCDRAGRAAAEVELRAQDEETIATICQRLDGIPLALELAAGCMAAMTPQSILRRLDERFTLLVGRRSASPRHRTLRAAVEWSEALLSPAERRVFHRLGVFAGGFDHAAAVAVAADSELPPEQVSPVLRRLVERSMVIVDRDAGEDRHKLLETMRDFALERMVAEGDAVRTRSAHAAHFTEQAALGLEAPERAMLDRLEREIGNYRAALEYTRSTLSPNLATLALRLKPLWLGVLGPAEGRLWLEAALSVSPEDARTPIWLRQCLTAVAAAGGDMAAARSYSLEGLALSQELGDPRLHCEMLDCMASVEVCSDVPAALAYAEKGLEIARTLDHPLTLVTTYGMVIDVLREAGESDRAASLLEEAVATMGRIEEPVTRSRVELMAREQLAEEQVRFGDAEARLRFQREMLEWGEYDFPHLATLSRVAALLVNAGRPLRAVRLAGAIDEACKRRGFDTGVLWGSDDREVLDDALRAMGPRGRAIYDAGRDMSMDETRTYALDDAQDDALSGVHLTRREREVADLVRQGLTDPQIARLLHLSPRTVEGHVENLRGKLGVNTRAGVAAWAAVSLP